MASSNNSRNPELKRFVTACGALLAGVLITPSAEAQVIQRFALRFEAGVGYMLSEYQRNDDSAASAPRFGGVCGRVSENAAIANDISRAICGPWKRSRTMARLSTGPEPAPRPWTRRIASRVSAEPAAAQPRLLST